MGAATKTGAAVFEIERRDQIAALASPVRQVILDALAAAGGPCSVAWIGEAVGRPADSLYYHLRVLARVGLIRRVERPRGGQPNAEHYAGPARRVRILYDYSSPAFRRSILRMMTAMLRATERDLTRAVADPKAVGGSRRRNTWAGRAELRLTGDQLEEANRLIRELFALQHASGSTKRGRRYAVTVALARLPDRR